MPIPTIPKDLTPAAPTEATAYQDYSNFQEMTPASFEAQFAAFEVRMEATKKELQAQIQEEQDKLAQTLKNLKSGMANLETRIFCLEYALKHPNHVVFKQQVIASAVEQVADALDALHTGVPHISVVQCLTRDGEKYDS